jgi:CCR4-NOT transcription complex subunit 1
MMMMMMMMMMMIMSNSQESVVPNLHLPNETNGMANMSAGNAATMMQSGISQAREFDDPPGLHDKAEYLLREWVNMYHSPSAGRDSTRAFTCFVQQACGVSVLTRCELLSNLS